MAPTALVGPDIDGGEQLIERLERDGMPMAAAFWYWAEGMVDWELVLASPLVDQEGTLAGYTRIHRAYNEPPKLQLPMLSLAVVGTDDRRVRIVRAKAPIATPAVRRSFSAYLPELLPDYGPDAIVYAYKL